MRSIQEIFNTVIASGYYGDRGRKSSPFMCLALRKASSHLVIGADEYARATAEIQGYLRQLQEGSSPSLHSWSLRAELAALNLPSSDEDCLAIYKDWESRPFVTHFPSFIGEVDYTDYYGAELDALGDFETWLRDQYATQGDQYANLSQYGFFCILPKKGSRVTARFRVMRKVTRGNRREVSGMARVAYTQGGRRGVGNAPSLGAWVEGVQVYLNSLDPSILITEWDYER